LFSSFVYSPASKATTHTTTATVHVPEPVESMHHKNEPTMDPSTMNPSSSSPLPPIVFNAFKEENSGGDGPCETIKMATKKENVLSIMFTKNHDDDKRRLKISSNENDATTKVENDADDEGYDHIGEGAVL
jgi:hypothetical protein